MNKFWSSSVFFLFHSKLCLYWKYVMDHLYPWFEFYFPIFQTHYHTSKYSITKKNKIRTKHNMNHNIYCYYGRWKKSPCLMNSMNKICSMFKQTPSALEQVWKYSMHIIRYVDALTYSFFLVQESFFLINHFNKRRTWWTLTH